MSGEFPPAHGPFDVALARSVDRVPEPTATRSWSWEMKLDGFRGVLLVGPHVELWSRRGADLSATFPELVEAARARLSPGVYDGEIVVWRDGRLDWDSLAGRGGSPARVAGQARAAPASFAAFDLLADAAADARPLPWAERRALLEARGWEPPLQLCPHTLDYAEATAWFASPDLRRAGVEGLVAKATASRYRPGARDWLKVKTRETAEVVVGAVTGSLEQPTSVIAGRYTAEGDFVVVGRTVRLQPAQSVGLARVLAAAGEHPWPPRFGGGFGAGPVDVVRVRPAVVADVSADAARQAGHRWRHPLRLVRLRPDLTVADVDLA